MALNNLAVNLSAWYAVLGAMMDLDGAIVLDREALHLCPRGHPKRSTFLKNLACHLFTQYDVLRAMTVHFVAIGQVTAIGESELVSVGTELTIIGERIEGLATFTSIEGPESCIPRVSEEVTKNEWVHLACHDLPNRKQPFESAFALHDGHFTIELIIRCELENVQFAYLSACHTTVGDEEIHLASAMQFSGFHSVIGMMWAVDDGQTNKITSRFYENMMDESGRLDHTRAAVALNKTINTWWIYR